MKSFKFQRLFMLLFLVPTVSSLIITSVYAGKKKFKTFSFGTPLLPSIVKVEPNKFHLTFRQYKYLRTPQFKIEGTIPLKAPTIIKEKFRPDPNPKVTEFNFGDMSAIHGDEANQQVFYDNSQNNPVFVEPPKNTPMVAIPPGIPLQPSSDWKPIINQSPVEFGETNHFPTHHRIRRFANEYNNQFDPNLSTHNLNGGNFGLNYNNQQGFPSFMSSYSGPNSHLYTSPNYQNYLNPNMSPFSVNSNPSPYSNLYPAQNNPNYQFNNNPNTYHSSHDMTASSSSLAAPKYERFFNPSNHQNNKWIPIVSPSVPSVTQSTSSGHSNSLSDQNQKKVNIGEHYNPSASYVDEKMVEKPTYDPDESEPDEGSVSFSISGPHGGEDVPAGYEAKIKEMHEQLKDNPQHIPPGLDMSQVMKYYNHHTFTEPLKTKYGFKPAFGPLGFLKSKLKSWKNILPV